jgi:predicted RNA-binding protein YlqC (UPF0109 family)
MSEIDQQFIEYVVKSLVGKPDAVHIDRRIDEKGVLLELTVDPEDLGRVIGKRGATAQSLRTLLRALGTKNDARYNLKIIDIGTCDHARSNDDAGGNAPAKDVPADVQADDSADKLQPKPKKSKSKSDEPEPEETPAKPDEQRAEPVEAAPEPEPKEEAKHEDETSDRLAQARKELADLDDLDV